MLFFNIVFFGFRAQFWNLLGLQLGTKLAILGFKTFGGSPPLSDLKLKVFKNSVLEGSRLDFEGPAARFGRVWGRFFETFAGVFGMLP